ncbi:uncharacterized protein LOC116207593 [Punica granatum]|uniref:Uncharacterized protein n=2 Tax=Punica granatum TaxID=22663 RepID=A0A218W3U0_PUNGR|nr:uncharacterized protein LOC116207593 [Punica granatum]XP_031396466.1 uncharacterized protein LOC116207593 [Punica granatum]OWM67199.1 hypothetical protein CDL15_Pgr000651 [Punica granatum]PKI72199.1 hypothetical protein CRG98_007397 [Punica granatum]
MSTTVQPCPCFTFPLARHLQLQSLHPKMPAFRTSSRLQTVNSAKYGQWDSNAEEMGPNKRFDFDPRDEGDPRSGRRKRRWWSDDLEEEEEDEDEEEMGIVEEVLDSIWILKVFSSYGWTLPVVLLSLLLATGPKAFLMAMVLPLGQAAATLAFNRLSGKRRTRPRVQPRMRRRRRRRRKRPSNAGSNFRMDGGGQRGRSWKSRNENLGAQSRVDNGNISTDGGNGAPSFGGWEELDGVRFREKSSGAFDRSSAKMKEQSRRHSSEEAPLLLRLLIGMFPFLGFWTKMFW